MDQITTVIIGPILTVTGEGGGSVIVVDNLDSTSATSALSAKQGNVLKGLIEEIEVGTDAATLNGEDPAFYLNRENHTGNTPAANIALDATHRFTTDTEKATWNAKQNALGFTPVANNDSRLSDPRTPTAHQHAMTDVTGLAAALSAKANSTDVTTSLAGKVDKVDGKGLTTNDYTTAEKDKLAALENYDDTDVNNQIATLEANLSDKVDKITGKVLSTNDYTTAEKNKLAGLSNYDDAAIQASVSSLETNKANTSDLAAVATSGDYDDLTGKPTIRNTQVFEQADEPTGGTYYTGDVWIQPEA